MFLKVRPKNSSLNLGNFSKLAAKYCGHFEVLDKIGPISYELALPDCIRVHNVFHVSLLKKYIPDISHVIDWNVIQVEPEGDFLRQLVAILGNKVKLLRNQEIRQVKVQWTHYNPEDAT